MKNRFFVLLLALLLLLPAGILAEEEGEADFFIGDEPLSHNRLSDKQVATYMTLSAGKELTVQFSQALQGIYVEWYTLPSGCTISWYTLEGGLLEEQALCPAFLNEYYPAPEQAACCVLRSDVKIEIGELSCIPEGELPVYVQQWEKPLEAPAFMLLCGYPGDELLYFGGLLPTAVNEGVPLCVAYMSNYSRRRLGEGLEALWQLGIKHYPVLLDIPTRRNREVKYLNANWKNQSAAVYTLLAEYKPQVLISFDEGGERLAPFQYEGKTLQMGEAHTAVTGMNLKDALAKKDPYSGPVLIKATEGRVQEAYDRPLGYYNNQTALEAAQAVFDSCYDSLHTFHYRVEQGNGYALLQGETAASSLFALCSYEPLYAPVPQITPEPTAEPTPEPTREPSPEPTKAVTQEPTVQPQATEAAAKADPSLLRSKGLLFWGAILAAAVFAVLLLVRLKNKKLSVLSLILIPVLILLLAAAAEFLLYMAAPQQTEAILEHTQQTEMTPLPTHAPTREPTAEPTQEPTPEPTSEPTAEPTATPLPGKWEDKFLEKGQENILVDIEKGHWQYSSDSLHIDIHRHKDEEPTVWFTAHLYMQEDAFRPVFGNEARTGRTSYTPWKIARLNKAVLLVTGDNMLNLDAELKGIMLRDGHTYNVQRKNAIMAWDPFSYGIATYEKDVYVEELLEKGYENTLTFGPILLKDGVINESAIKLSHVFKANPRVALGMVEPGHLVIIVVDGRRDEYSKGVTLLTLAEMLLQEGCLEAYNMDGGVSACMIFMGEQLNSHGNVRDWSQQRPMPDGLVFGYSEQVPLITDPIYNDGIDVSYDKRS